MNEFNKLTKMLAEAKETLERLAAGDESLLDKGTSAHDIADLITAVQGMAGFLEDEMGKRLTRADDSEVEEVIDGWLNEVEAWQIDALVDRHGK